MNKRIDGYYWVMVRGEWEIAYWQDRWWRLIGASYTVDDDYFAKIGDCVLQSSEIDELMADARQEGREEEAGLPWEQYD